MDRLFAAMIGLACVFSMEAEASARADSPPIHVLFLGDRGHHAPSDRAAQIAPVLALRGIDVVYTEDLGALNPENLQKYDAVFIYANIDSMPAEREQALWDYVEGGGGFVPIHCASACLGNSDRYIALVGGRFQSHGTGEFDTKIVEPDHPIMAGFQPFRTWDETYVHDRHNTEGRRVLQIRDQEPYTWVRTQGKGRIFYTAYGHDSRTWEQPGFQALLERGIRWAADRPVFDERPAVHQGLKPAPMVDSGVDIPNYLASDKWGEQGEPLRTMPSPLGPGESARHLVLPNGFEAHLFAAEPEIVKPICMAWDHRGRLWIAESLDYPNRKLPKGEGRDRIVILEDRDGDGRAETFTVFAEGLNIPTSLCFADGGVIVAQAPDFLFLKDSDGDDKADVRRVLFTGWGTSDTHAGPSNLRFGFDNWIWGIVGYAGFDGTVGGERQRFGQGFFRFKPDGSKLEFVRSTNNNSWGVGVSEEGLIFGSTANGCPSVFPGVPNRYYESVRGWSPSVLRSIAATNAFYPVTDKVRQVDWHGGFTAAAGHALYTARAYPQPYWNSTAFVADPTGHLVATFTLQPKGSDFASYNGWNILASDDEWTAPINAEVGPDGNVWIIDWYNYIVQHNPTPQGFKTGKGAAYETPLRDQTHGRIYKIAWKDGQPSKQGPLDPADAKGLVAALKSDNLLWRQHAQRLLVERGERDVVPALRELAADRSVDAIGLNPGAIHALWTLKGLGALEGGDGESFGAAAEALGHPSAGVRRAALLTLPRDAKAVERILAAGSLNDSDAQVRLAALLTLADLPENADAARALALALAGGLGADDHWLADAATSAAAAHAEPFLKALAETKAEGEASKSLREIVERVAEHYARGEPADTAGGLLAALAPSAASPFGRSVAGSIVAGLVKGWPANLKAKLNDESEAALAQLIDRLPLEARGSLASLGSRWGSRALDEAAGAIAKAFLATLGDESKSDAERGEAALRMIELRPDDDETAADVIDRITPRTSPELASRLVEALAKSRGEKTGAALIAATPAMTPAPRAAAVRVALGRADWTEALLDAVEAGRLSWDEFSLDQRQALASHPSKTLAEKARRLIAQGGALPDADRQAVIDRLSKIVMEGGDAARGKIVYAEYCAKCHKHSGEGGDVGPDLTGMASHPRSELLVHIIDPSRSVEGNFIQYTVATNDGRVFNGILASESKTSIELLDADAKTHVILRDEIDELTASRKSIMPEGFEKQFSDADMTNLLAFLTRRGKFLPLDIHKAANVVTTRGMFYDEKSPVERLVFPDWSPKTFEGVPYQLVDPKGDRAANAIMLHSPLGALPPKMPKSVELPCNAPAKVIHILGGVSGWGYNGGEADKTVSMIVRIHYADGQVEDHPLLNGVHLADYIRVMNVPGSELAFDLNGRQIRHVAVRPERPETIDRIELVKGSDHTAPVVMAVTLEGE